jgi:signal transduction histidine kinase
LLQLALAGTASQERLRLGSATVLVAYIPLPDNRVGRAVAPLDVLSELERTIGYIAVLGLPVMLACSYVLSRLLVARVMIPIRDVFTYQELYSANLSHELLSPLTALKGGMDVTLRRERSPDEYRRALADGLRQVDRIVDLVNDLQLLTSARFRPADLLREPVRLLDLVDDGVAARRGTVAERGLKIEVQAPDDVECSADRTLVRRVLENLLDNAVKYTPRGGSITVRLDREGSNAVLRVGNDCPPLAGAAREQLFQPFSRGPGTGRGSIPGRGLGLYIARYIARSHGGDLVLLPSAESHFDVSLVLPLRSASGWRRPA